MKKALAIIVLSCILFVTSCAALDSVFLPNEDGTPSDTMQGVQSVGAAAAAVGGPYALPVLAVTNLLTIIAGFYTNARKKQVITNKDEQLDETEKLYENVQTVVEAIVKAVEDSDSVVIDDEGTTVKDVIKEKVADKLAKSDAYTIGKAIIDAIKAEK